MGRHTSDLRRLPPLGWAIAIALAAALFTMVPVAPLSAYADSGLSSTVISNALPGMVEAPAGPVNGPITPSELTSILGESGPASALSQEIADGDVSAYLRAWSNEPSNGAFVEVIATQLPSLADASSALAGADHAVTGIHFGHFPVGGIPHAIGVTLITNSQLGVVSEMIVQFAKGTDIFDVVVGQVTTAANSGAPELSEPDVIQIARQQAARAVGPVLGPTSPDASRTSNVEYEAGGLFGLGILVVLVACLVVILVQRRNGRQAATAALPDAWMYPPPPPLTQAGLTGLGSPGMTGTPPTGRRGAALLELPTASKSSFFYCSWCGTAVPIGPNEVHDCGPRDQRGVYCMNCGTPFADGATICASCGNRKLQ